jgi:hypothetical protein
MRTLSLTLITLLSSSAFAYRHQPGDSPKKTILEYGDILVGEAVGEFRSREYDLGDFKGTATLGGGVGLFGGGGLRYVLGWPNGVRLNFDGSIAWGRLRNVDGPFGAYSTVMRGELLSGVGYEIRIADVVVLHTATVMGLAGQSLKAVAERAVQASAPGAVPPTLQTTFELKELSLRLGQQVGAHVQVADLVALYADATFDYDGQWRVRGGLSIGHPVHPE